MRFLKEGEESYNISLPSMTDIIFLLLLFFMVATVLKDSSRRLDVQLPESRSGETAEVSRVTIEMAEDGTIALNGDIVSLAELEGRLRAAGPADKPPSVVIKADKRLAYGKVVEVMGLCQASGIVEIAVAVK